MKNLKLGSIWVIWLIFLSTSLWGQGGLKPAPFNPGLYQSLQWRNVGPFRGGRCVAVTGVPDQPLTYYMGSTGGGVWKTDDGGLTWANISDGFFHVGSVGAIAVAPSDPNVLYVGTGEHAVRGVMTSHGDGVYKSENGGKTWSYMGLDSSRHISAIRVHPNNANIVYVAVQGAVYGPATERGVYRSMDGGNTWERVLFINETTGASDLSIDWNNPRILYVGMWDHLRTPWNVRSGGPGSGLYKSIDGGTKWEKLTTGLPLQMGKVGIDVSRANSSVVYANIEADNGGVFRSENGGQTWEHINNQRNTQARAWYYMEVVADPANEQCVYILNAPLLRSIDGGRTFVEVANPHTDQHALWINPHNPANMILGNDGGATITFNAGRSWSAQDNQPTGQFYRVITDSRFPYHIYGGQQDAMPISIASRTMTDGIGNADWHEVAGGESAFIAFNPEQPDLIYGTSYQGNIEVYDEQTGFRKDIMHYPTVGLAELPRDMKFRFNWNAPLITSPQDSRVLYHAANKVLRSRNGGYNWEEVSSADLTRNERDKQGAGGGPYTNEGAGGENYNTISYMAISPKDMRVIWVGSDDGLVHLSRDEGQRWVNVTPPDLPESIINSIEASPHNAGTAYITAIRYKFNDFSPIVYVTTDYGQTWTKIVRGIAPEDFVRVVREDPKRPGLLYAGTETGLYISTDKGRFWRRFQLNLPVCPINDLTIRDNDLIAATSGRGFWVLDDLSAIQQTAGRDLTNDLYLVPPNKSAVRFAMAGSSASLTQGQNPLPGVIIYYNLPVNYDSIEITMLITDERDTIIRRFSNRPQAEYQRYEGGPEPPAQLTSHAGLNRFYWDLRRDPIMHVPGLFVLGDYAAGMVAPGTYKCKLQVGNKKLEERIRVSPDPRLEAKDEDYAEQQRLLLDIENSVVEIHQLLQELRELRSQMENIKKQLENVDQPDMVARSERIIRRISDWESKVAQPRQKTYQDAINFPNKLNAAFLDLHARIDSHDPKVTEGAETRFHELQEYWDILVSERNVILNKEIEAFNDLYVEKKLPPLILPQPKPINAW